MGESAGLLLWEAVAGGERERLPGALPVAPGCMGLGVAVGEGREELLPGCCCCAPGEAVLQLQLLAVALGGAREPLAQLLALPLAAALAVRG